MILFDVVIIALVQGLSEFLPISSSGHIVLVERILDFTEKQFFYNVMVHCGTLFSILVFFRKKLTTLLLNSIQEIKEKKPKEDSYFIFTIILATIPAGIAGLIFKKELLFFYEGRNIVYLSFFFFLMAIYLYLTKNTKSPNKSINLTTALLIGLSQILALLPGLSRSGITITTALLLGIRKQEAFNFSFFIGIPLFFGAFLLEILELITKPNLVSGYFSGSEVFTHNLALPIYLTATALLVSFIVGWLALKILYQIVLYNQFYRFSYYLIFISLITLWISW